MGYYTEIIVSGATRKSGRREEDEDTELEIIERVNGLSDRSGLMKLSEDNDPIAEVSREYPDFIIEVEGRGGDQEDLWRRRYLNGESETIYPDWPPFTEISVPEHTSDIHPDEQGIAVCEKAVFDGLVDDYRKNSEVCLAEYLASAPVAGGMTYEQAFDLYIKAMKEVEGDRFYVIKEKETIEL